ncbi:alpha-2,8-polysialyltransferase family protein [Enterococcus faecium]|uniref:alpha-2,8-polysialyltransferase family protein n=2 Tax=Enterococcus faecium TaxID=1352 RepID=UPI001EE78788|nr:alpha-2,8-polysialyltransferase family protein [Enterococcus faecium]
MHVSLKEVILKSLYIVSTPYHLLVALSDIIEKNIVADILFTSNELEDQIFYKNIICKLTKFDFINKIFIVSAKKKISRHFGIDNIFKKVKKNNYLEVNVFSWNLYYAYSNSNKYINFFYKKNTPINLFEDGKTMYLAKEKGRIFRFLCVLLNVNTFPQNLYKINQIYASNSKKFPLKYQYLLQELCENKVYDNLTKYLDSIIYLFLKPEQIIQLNALNNLKKTIVFSQPLYKDGFLKKEEDQRIVYSRLLKRYQNKGQLIIFKKHPRDVTKYNFTQENLLTIEGKIPSEIFKLLNIEFENSVGISSSAIEGVAANNYFYSDLEDLLSQKEVD